MDWAFEASAVLALVKMDVIPVASETAVDEVEFALPEDEELVLVLSPPPRALEALLALPLLYVVETMREGPAKAVALLVLGPPSTLVLVDEVVVFCGAEGLIEVSWELRALLL